MRKAQVQNAAQDVLVSREDIASRAYERYLARGSADGFDIDDWLAAEQELTRKRMEPDSSRRPRVRKPEAA